MRTNSKKVTLTGGEELELTFNFNTIVDFEDATGINLMAGGFENRSPRVMRALVWALAKPSHPDLTEEQAGALLTIGDMEIIMKAVASMMNTGAKQQDAGGKAKTQGQPGKS